MKKEKKPWSKTKKIVVPTIIGAVVLSFGLGVGLGFGYTDPKLTKELTVNPYYSTWMSALDENAKLTEIVLPGSHDAGTNKMMAQARTQGHDIIDQLKAGVRYFDVRFALKGDDPVIFHGPIKGQKAEKVLNEFKEFIEANPSEFIIIDMQHLGDGADEKSAMLINDILPLEKRLVLNNGKLPSTITMKKIREEHKNYIVTWRTRNQEEKDFALQNNFSIREDNLQSPYEGDIHKESNEALIKQFNEYYTATNSSKFFVLQAQRTCKTLLGKPSEYEKKFNKPVSEYIRNIKNDPTLLARTNIIMRDFIVSDEAKVKDIIDLNKAKGYM